MHRSGGLYVGPKELKSRDFAISGTTVATTGTILSSATVGLDQGSTIANRIGQQYTIFGWHLKWHALMVESTNFVNNHDTAYLYVYQDKQTNGAAAVPGDIFLAGGASMSFRNLENRSRFKILAKRKIVLYATAAGYDGAVPKIMFKSSSGEIHLKMRMKCVAKGVTDSISNLTQNNIGIMAISEHGLMAIHYHGRIRFKG